MSKELWTFLGVLITVVVVLVGVNEKKYNDIMEKFEAHRGMPVHPMAGERLSSLEARLIRAEQDIRNHITELQAIHSLLEQHERETSNFFKSRNHQEGR